MSNCPGWCYISFLVNFYEQNIALVVIMPIIYLVQRCFSQRVSFSNLEVFITIYQMTPILHCLVTMSFLMKASVVTFLSSLSS